MTESRELKLLYQKLIDKLNIESQGNLAVIEFLDEVRSQQNVFQINLQQNEKSKNLELIRSLNRYSDEFNFNDTEIKIIISKIYDSINSVS